jgi:flavin reductase (DIM6/NTAB) family NADH-FMN oxidoreductase RutF
MDAKNFRTIMRQQAGAVALICTGSVGTRFGLTATAVCSLTDDPPTILVCVNRSASAHDTIEASGKFSVNLLGTAHTEIAGIFAGQTDLNGEDRFNVEGYAWEAHASGTPRLVGAIAHMDCSVTEQQQFSSHSLFIGRVNEGGADDGVDPLIYFRGRFAQLTDI